ncbi:VOC family protein [Pseudonocardia zijingensis]|uniref:VOC family protein n=1 Tax=Pseudonocardia zijingensis TaxID=153376 RepID=A0ABP4BEM7_9PSEU
MATTQIFLNLPIDDQKTTKAFWTALGYSYNADFSDDHALALEIGPGINAMLLSKARFAEFATRPTSDGSSTEVILALGVESRDEVDRVADAALANGGGKATDPQDHGFMYGRSFIDPDGHHWEVVWMDLSGGQD